LKGSTAEADLIGRTFDIDPSEAGSCGKVSFLFLVVGPLPFHPFYFSSVPRLVHIQALLTSWLKGTVHQLRLAQDGTKNERTSVKFKGEMVKLRNCCFSTLYLYKKNVFPGNWFY
jgi:hypothetical protein